MKHILFYTAAILILCIVARAQSDKPRQSVQLVYNDTPKARYQYFLTMRIDTTEYGKYIDTMVICNNLLGKSLLYDDALFWKQAHARAFTRINSRIFRDSIKLPEPAKPKK